MRIIPKSVIKKLILWGMIIKKSLCKILSIAVAWISTPGWFTDTGVFLLSFKPVPAGTFAPIRTILSLNSLGSIMGFLPVFIAS